MSQYNKTIQKLIHFNDGTKKNQKNVKEHNPNWPEIIYNPYRILIAEISWSGKVNAILGQINYEPDINKICLYSKDPYENKYQFLINKRESTGLKHLKNSKFLFNIPMMIFIKILKNIFEIKNVKYW